MKDIFSYLSYITYHDIGIGEREKIIVLHTTSGRTLILEQQASYNKSLYLVLAWFGLGVANKNRAFCLEYGFDSKDETASIPLLRGKHWNDIATPTITKSIYDNRGEPTPYHNSLSSLRTALHFDINHALS